MRDSAIVGRLVAARNVLGEECAYPGSTFGSEDADSAWEELCLAVDEIEAECKSSVTDSGGSFRQDLVKAIAPLVIQKVLETNKNIDFFEFEEYVAKRTNKLVNLLIEGGPREQSRKTLFRRCAESLPLAL